MTAQTSTVTVKFFALVREQVGTEEIVEQYQAGDTINAIRERLMARGNGFELALSGTVVSACNQTMVKGEHAVKPDDEIAFFPPVTGG